MPATADEADLYVVVPEQFAAARDAVVKRLRSEGDKAGAARVAKLRRPPLTTWALNQMARTSPDLIEDLLDAGRALRAAMERALGGDASELRQARTAERSAVDAVVAEALRRLAQGGYSPADVMQQRMAATLRAAIVDEQVADLLRSGLLDRDYEAPGFGMDSLAAPLTLVHGGAGREPNASEEETVTDDAGPAEQAEQAELADRADRRRLALEEADRRAAAADELTAEADRLVAEAERLAAEAKEAGQRATSARSRAEAAIEAAAAQRREFEQL